jgi:diacylglycerol kinase family enzyme
LRTGNLGDQDGVHHMRGKRIVVDPQAPLLHVNVDGDIEGPFPCLDARIGTPWRLVIPEGND